MTPEMQAKLARYMKENGYYNTAKIREDAGQSAVEARFWDIFGDDDDQQEGDKSEMLQAAEAFNTAKLEANAQSTPHTFTVAVPGDEHDFQGYTATYDADEILDALLERDTFKSQIFNAGTHKVYANEYAFHEYDPAAAAQEDEIEGTGTKYQDIAKARRQEARQRIMAKLELADQLFAAGYRLKFTERAWHCYPLSVPISAIVEREVWSGYLANQPTRRIAYVVKKP